MTSPDRLPAGKLPQNMLAALLATVAAGDPRVVVGPGIGRDAAVIDTGGPKLLIAKSDPVTLATDQIGAYTVHVNANDIACMGGTPAWFLATVLLPENCPASLPGEIFGQITAACAALGIQPVGGHTEMTYGLARPLVIGAMLGEVERDRLVDPAEARPGDAVLLAGGIAVEGTAVLAREAPGRLHAAGIGQETIERAAGYLDDPGISVVAAARAACDAARVHAMHDPTEGGLATALHELAAACGTGVRVDQEAIDVLPECAAICRALDLDPLGLLASGALLVAAAEDDSARVVAAINAAGTPARRIGTLVPPEERVIMTVNREARALPGFARDEVARFFSGEPEGAGGS